MVKDQAWERISTPRSSTAQPIANQRLWRVWNNLCSKL